jgi:chromosome segregation ATPase
MDRESELQRLEKFVEKILTRFSALKADKSQLEQDVYERDLLIEELRDTIASKVTERNEISERVNKIVDQIEDWELNLDENDAVIVDESIEVADSDEDELHAEELDATRVDEEERRVQHDLFSMTGSKK